MVYGENLEITIVIEMPSCAFDEQATSPLNTTNSMATTIFTVSILVFYSPISLE